MYYIIIGTPRLKITYDAGMQKRFLLRDVYLNEYDAIDYVSEYGPSPVNFPDYFKQATNVDKLLILGKKIPCTKIHGSIMGIRAARKVSPKPISFSSSVSLV